MISFLYCCCFYFILVFDKYEKDKESFFGFYLIKILGGECILIKIF